jgi:hypothetical protein
MRARSNCWTAVLGVAAALILAVPVALAAGPSAAPVSPGLRIDLKVLLLAQDSGQAAEWQALLTREGVPHDTVITGTAGALTDAKLADYGANRAKYQAVVLAFGNLEDVLPASDKAALDKFQKTFGIRQLSDQTFPNAAHGLNGPTQSGSQDGVLGTLTPTGKLAFPYLKSEVPVANDDPGAAETFGHLATPLAGADFQTLVTGPGNSSLLGIYTDAEGREEMVMTVNSNQFQSHNQLLRHGMLNWVTRGVYLGHQRNYLELHVDDIFLPDDSWDPVTNTTNYDPDAAIRMSAADVSKAVQWSQQTGLKLDMVFNGAGNEQFGGASDPLLAPLRDNKNSFRWIDHTYEHPNLDCSTQTFIQNQITQNRTWATSRGFGDVVDSAELVTGEHSGLANAIPGNPGTIDPPTLEDVSPEAGGALAAGTYEYGVTARTARGETPASTSETIVGANGRVRVQWGAVCKATGYDVYRRSPSGTGAWVRVGTVPQPASPFTNAGAVTLEFADSGAAGTAATPPTGNTAAVDPYAQNPAFLPALTATGIKYTGSDASKPYPQTPTNINSPRYPAGAAFFMGDTQAVPRYPTNVYYNAATQEQQLDEYNWIYVLDDPATPAAEGNCQPIPNVTTCRTTPATWQEYIDSEARIMFGHVVGNDPRPHYFHQTNIAMTNTTGGTLYKLVDAVRTRYTRYYADNAPLVQLSMREIGDELARQASWRQVSSQVQAYIQDGKVNVTAPAGTQVPLTGTSVGTSWGGHKSGWTTVSGSAVFEPSDPAATAAPAVTGSVAAVGGTLTAGPGTWSGTPTIAYSYQWQRCNAQGSGCQNIAGATAHTYQTQAADKDQRLRVVVAAANWISSYSQAASVPTAPVGATGTIEVIKKVVAAEGVPEQGRFDLTVGGAVKADEIQNGGSTGAVEVPIGKHSVGEAAGAGTVLDDYSARIACSAPGRDDVAGDGNALEVTVALGDQWNCTITNTRRPQLKPEPTPTPNPDPGPKPPNGGDGGKQVTLSSLSISPKRFALRGSQRGASVSWQVSDRAILRLTLQRTAKGRRVAGRCRPITKAIRSRPTCRRFVSLRTITRSVAGGAGSLKLVKRFGGTRLRPGAYRLIVTAAADASAQPSPPRAVSFKVVQRAG